MSPGLLRFEDIDGLTLENLRIRADSRLYAVDLAGCVQNARIKNCLISNGGTGGCVMARNGGTCPAGHLKITGNKFSSGGHPMSGDSHYPSGPADEAVAVFGWVGRMRDVVISGNRVTARGSFGITAYGSGKPGGTGRLEDAVIRDNAVTGGKNGGIAIMDGASSVKVSGNRVVSAKDGIFIDRGGRGLLRPRDVRVLDNSITGSGRYGIFAAGRGVKLSGNRIRGCGAAGIFAAVGTLIGRNRISGCRPPVFIAVPDGNGGKAAGKDGRPVRKSP